MLKTSYADGLGLSLVISAQFTLEIMFGVQGRSSFIDVGTTGKIVSSACYGKQQVCVYLYSRAILTS